MRVPLSVRRALLGLTTLAVVSGGSLVAAPASAAPTPQSRAAAGWLASELKGGLLRAGGFAQYGPTLDTYFTLNRLDLRPRARGAILDAFAGDVRTYIGTGTESYAGPTGKLLTAVITGHRKPRDFGNVNLVARLADRVRTGTGPQRGRAVDRSDFGDFSNTIGQSFVVRGFAAADHRLLGMTTRFLLKQQCDRGFFREDMDSDDFTCQGGRAQGLSRPDVDSTAFAVLALRAARRAGVLRLGDDIRDARRWLRGQQKANGSFVGVDGSSANSTGLAATVLSGRAATRAAVWVSRRQVTVANSRGTALRGDVGAIANDRAAFRAAAEDGITGATRPSWYIATAQAAPGLKALRGR